MFKAVIDFLRFIWRKLEKDSRKADHIQDRLALINEERYRQMRHHIKDLM